MRESPGLPASRHGAGPWLARAVFAQFEALDLAGRGLWQFVEKSDPARAFERRQHSPGVVFKRWGEIVVRRGPGFDDDKRLGLAQTVGVRRADDRGFEHVFVRDQ